MNWRFVSIESQITGEKTCDTLHPWRPKGSWPSCSSRPRGSSNTTGCCGELEMPYHTAQARPRHNREDLVQKIVAEFGNVRPPFVSAPPGSPDIYEEQQRFSDRLHVYVVWDAWEQVPDEVRGEIILDAYERHFGATR